MNSNEHWCDCSPGTDLIQGWCVKTSLVEAKKNDYIRIQNELLDVKNRLVKSANEEPSHQLLSLLKVTSILLILFINPWRESIQNWLVGSMYHVLGETSIVSIQSGGLFLMDHWNIALMILICIHLFMVFHFYNRRSLNSKMK